MSLRILFITQDDPFYVRLFFEEFFRRYQHLSEIQGVVIAQAMGKKSKSKLARQMYDFYGPFDFFRMGMRYAAYKSLAAAPGFMKSNGSYNITQVCENHGIHVIHESAINAEPFLSRLQGMNLDLIISVAAPSIFKQNIIAIPKRGCINIHHAPLPKYRGMMPNFWQLYHGEQSVGMTIHEINPGIDDGRIILQKDVDIRPEETLDSVIKRTKKIGAHFMVEAIELIKSGKVDYKENPATEGTYFSFPTREDVKKFKRRGKKIM
jgi:methionyl-tRNA formyltransferase